MSEQRVIVRLFDRHERIIFERVIVMGKGDAMQSFRLPIEAGLFARGRVECEFDPPLIAR